jgi:hypothetical protein
MMYRLPRSAAGIDEVLDPTGSSCNREMLDLRMVIIFPMWPGTFIQIHCLRFPSLFHADGLAKPITVDLAVKIQRVTPVQESLTEANRFRSVRVCAAYRLVALNGMRVCSGKASGTRLGLGRQTVRPLSTDRTAVRRCVTYS